ncbi:MAG: family 43 glycosylhydrolase [Butyribacter sp.]|uniref:family 43 glycosylhydrolase n=1 Tax=Butyribacter TaxID=2822463 RepID=UPI000334CEE6|nr:family 43 glycosylhydrolase [Clostridium sp.]OKZ79246.1 MAG: hypothetical protein BHW08_11505 [Clostridium sp. CAG:12237_41]CCZ41894.1 endo-1 4-beta-xylanase [Clostridium sp. CAG:122]
MRKTKLFASILALSLVATSVPAINSFSGSDKAEASETEVSVTSGSSIVKEPLGEGEVEVAKSRYTNPIGGYDNNGKLTYGGDPAAMVDGDTVYLYTGHDVATGDSYVIDGWICYSTKDLLNWKYEGEIMSSKDISWANVADSAWAAQTVKHNGKYYFYYCTWDKTAKASSKIKAGEQSIGVAVSDSPTGPFKDLGKPIVSGEVTDFGTESSEWNDIDPTVWIEKDDKGEEHRYLAWGNGNYYICELNDDMISVKDQNGDGKITGGTSTKTADVIQKTSVTSYTEAPWLYRRQDANGNYYGQYYLFYASGWREGMSYATTDDLLNGEWSEGKEIARPNVTSNTNHMAVIDFKGKTYFIYHNGALAGGNGYRRVANITELKFNEDGSIDEVPETTAGIAGTTTKIYTKAGAGVLAHENFLNSFDDADYPYENVYVGAMGYSDVKDAQWVLTDGKSDKTKPAYVSIQSENKSGLYLTVNDNGKVTLNQDSTGTDEMAKRQTFRSVKALDGSEDGVSFESVYKPGQYLTIVNNALKITDGTDKAAATFVVGENSETPVLRGISLTAGTNVITQGQKISKINFSNVKAIYSDETQKTLAASDYKVDYSKVNVNKTGTQYATVSYTEGDITKTVSVGVTVMPKLKAVTSLKAKVTKKKKAKKAKVVLSWNYSSKVTGYEVYYKTSKNGKFKYATEVTGKKCTVSEETTFKAGKTYWVAVKAYREYNGKTLTGPVKSIKIKIKK